MHKIGDAVHDICAAEKLTPEIHQFGNRAAVADEFENLCRDQRHGFRMIQPQSAREALLREKPRLVQRQLVEFVWCEVHDVTAGTPRDRHRAMTAGS